MNLYEVVLVQSLDYQALHVPLGVLKDTRSDEVGGWPTSKHPTQLASSWDAGARVIERIRKFRANKRSCVSFQNSRIEGIPSVWLEANKSSLQKSFQSHPSPKGWRIYDNLNISPEAQRPCRWLVSTEAAGCWASNLEDGSKQDEAKRPTKTNLETMPTAHRHAYLF